VKIKLEKAFIENAEEIYQMQIKSFKKLLEKYKDYDLNPGNEKIERTMARINEKITDFYIIKMDGKSVGGIRIRTYDDGMLCKVGPLFVLPEYQNRGIAQKTFEIIEAKYKPKNGWILDTILEEEGNCHLYEKIGYKKTGKIEKVNEIMTLVFYEKKI
jgi:N-acetylglutamate synthase-like GNAT family acetyltransferase